MTQEESELLSNATAARDQLRQEESQLVATLERTEARLDMVREILAMLNGQRDEPRARNRNRPRRAETPAQPNLPQHEQADAA